jgi:hypothetical protein
MAEPFVLANCDDGLRHDRHAKHGRTDGAGFSLGLDSSRTCVHMQP